MIDGHPNRLAQRESALRGGETVWWWCFFYQFNPFSTFIQFHKNPRILKFTHILKVFTKFDNLVGSLSCDKRFALTCSLCESENHEHYAKTWSIFVLHLFYCCFRKAVPRLFFLRFDHVKLKSKSFLISVCFLNCIYKKVLFKVLLSWERCLSVSDTSYSEKTIISQFSQQESNL